jgi:hypothetical protein
MVCCPSHLSALDSLTITFMIEATRLEACGMPRERGMQSMKVKPEDWTKEPRE